MKTTLVAVCCFLFSIAGCSSAPTEDVAEQSQAAVGSYIVSSSSQAVPGDPTQFCHPVSFYGAGANSVANRYPWGVPWNGGVVSHGSVTVSAYPNQDGVNGPRPGFMQAVYDCIPYSQFNAGGGGQSGPFRLDWPVTQTLQSVSATATLWDTHSACWIDGMGHLSITGEKIVINMLPTPGTPTGFQWYMDVSGFPALMGQARCAWYGKPMAIATTHHVTQQQRTSRSWVTRSSGTCFITMLSGTLDDGRVEFVNVGPSQHWELQLGGSTVEARGYCVQF